MFIVPHEVETSRSFRITRQSRATGAEERIVLELPGEDVHGTSGSREQEDGTRASRAKEESLVVELPGQGGVHFAAESQSREKSLLEKKGKQWDGTFALKLDAMVDAANRRVEQTREPSRS